MEWFLTSVQGSEAKILRSGRRSSDATALFQRGSTMTDKVVPELAQNLVQDVGVKVVVE